jgi:alkylated DNA repair dioxygenase AlkB
MEQLSLFGDSGQTPGIPENLMEYQPGLFTPEESTRFLQEFVTTAPWNQRLVSMYGKDIITPRLTAWYGDPSANTADFHLLPWTNTLQAIREKVEARIGIAYNSVLLNYYRDGNDSVAWHSDNEVVMGAHPTIGSVSFGQVRRFDIRNKANHQQKYSVKLESGSLLIMKGNLQAEWDHRIPKSTQPMKERVNLTFRRI